jgi:branched-chain amino acid transport system substrate-binding protein
MRFPIKTILLAPNSGVAAIAVTAASVLLTTSLLIAPTAATAQEIIDIGFSSPLSGPQSAAGKDNQAGAQMAVDELNQKKLTIGGKPVSFRLLPEDDRATPRLGMVAGQKLVDAKVKAVVGPYNSDVAIALSRLFNDAGIVMVTVGSNPRITQQGFQYIFRLTPNDNQLGGEMAIYAARQLNLKKVLVIEDGTAYGQGLADAFVGAAKAGKIDIAGRKSSGDKPGEFGAILAAVKDQHIDGIFYGGYYTQAAALKIQMKKTGLDATLMGGDAICSAETAKLAGTAIDDKIYCIQGGARLGARASGKAFLADYRKLYGKTPSTFGPYFYDGAKMIGAAMQKADSTDPVRFGPVLATIRYAGVVGDYEFDAAHDLKKSPVTIYQFRNGEPIAVTAN